MRHPSPLRPLTRRIAVHALLALAFAFAPATMHSADFSRLRHGDLLFQQTPSGAFSDAIALATDSGKNPQMKITHVGIFAIIEGDSVVVEATSQCGVTVTPLRRFVQASAHIGNKPAIIARRVAVSAFPIDESVERALTHIGKPYDHTFLADNDSIYCSELVHISYLWPDGTPLFHNQPMNFKAPDGSMPRYWVELFEKLGQPIPQGQPGTNPADLSQSSTLTPVDL